MSLHFREPDSTSLDAVSSDVNSCLFTGPVLEALLLVAEGPAAFGVLVLQITVVVKASACFIQCEYCSLQLGGLAYVNRVLQKSGVRQF